MRIHHLSLAALLAFTASADARPRHIAVLDFDGPRILADAGRGAVVNVLGEQYDLVPTKRWEQAKMASLGRGPLQWSSAAKQAGVDAVIEGWVDPEGMRAHTMTIAVRDASTGRQIDTVSVKISDKGVISDASSNKLAKDLDDLLNWVDDDASTPPKGLDLPDVRTSAPALGSKQLETPEKPAASNCDGDDDDDDDDDCANNSDDRSHHTKRHTKRHNSRRGHHRARRDDRDDRDDDRDDRRSDADDKKSDDKKSDRDDSKDDAKPRVATADPATVPGATPGTASIIDIFGPDSVEAKTMTGHEGPVVQHPSPRFEIAGGGFLHDRGMSFTQDPPDFAATPPSYPSSGLMGFELTAAVFPMPTHKYGNDLTGWGATFDIQKSVNATISANDTVNDTYGDYTVDYTSWEGAIHYRYPITDLIMLDGQVSYGRQSYTLESDFPSSVQIPDVQYEFLGAGGNIELAVTDRTRLIFGARYLYTMSVGDASDEEWYGSGTASGLELTAGFRLPIGDMLYLKGMFTYTRFSMDFDGDGNLSTSEEDDSLAVSNITDSSFGGSLQLGVSF